MTIHLDDYDGGGCCQADSCSGCGGYHDSHYDCMADDGPITEPPIPWYRSTSGMPDTAGWADKTYKKETSMPTTPIPGYLYDDGMPDEYEYAPRLASQDHACRPDPYNRARQEVAAQSGTKEFYRQQMRRYAALLAQAEQLPEADPFEDGDVITFTKVFGPEIHRWVHVPDCQTAHTNDEKDWKTTRRRTTVGNRVLPVRHEHRIVEPAKQYAYAAVRGGDRWHVTGAKSPQNISWVELVNWIGDGADTVWRMRRDFHLPEMVAAAATAAQVVRTAVQDPPAGEEPQTAAWPPVADKD